MHSKEVEKNGANPQNYEFTAEKWNQKLKMLKLKMQGWEIWNHTLLQLTICQYVPSPPHHFGQQLQNKGLAKIQTKWDIHLCREKEAIPTTRLIDQLQDYAPGRYLIGGAGRGEALLCQALMWAYESRGNFSSTHQRELESLVCQDILMASAGSDLSAFDI